MLYFFLSYAREDDPEFIRRFFHDLSSHVRNLAGVGKTDAVGFLDEQNVQIGERWSAELSDALSACACFVAMTSPRYFGRDYCGREWHVFSERLETYERRFSKRAPALLPVRWIPTNPMHPLAAEIQSANASMVDAAYLEYGLRQLQDLRRFRDNYRTFVFELARRIVQVAKDHEVPRPPRPFRLDQVPNIFNTRPNGRAAGPAPTKRRAPARRRASGRTVVHFVVVVGSRTEVASIRSELGCYGESPTEWAPYRPALDEALAEYASQVADDRHFDSQIGDIFKLGARIDRAKRRNEVVVLLVDAWSTNLPRHRQALSDYDAREEITSAVMIPFNSLDTETLENTTVLQAQLALALPRILERRDRVMLRQNIPTPEQFCTDLEEILEVAQNRIFKRGEVTIDLPATSSLTRPILEGPTDGTNP